MFDLISISEAIKRSYDSEGLLVDVRSEEAFKKGHLPMAVNLPFEEIMDEKSDIEAIEKDFNIEKEQPVFLYCDTGSTSMLAAKKLDSVGIHAYSVVGGIMFYKGYLEKEKNDLWTMVRTS
nr:rhodanese-like domain-containing protein [uncultured Anaerobutyricum sp.]